MEQVRPSLLNRDDTFFGVCEGLGEDLGIPSNLLRVALACVLFWNPYAALGAYIGAAVIVAVTRWIAPAPQALPSSNAGGALLASSGSTDGQASRQAVADERAREEMALAA